MGGQPPKNGDIYAWVDKVIDNPMPISVKVLPLSDLFDKLKISGFNAKTATAQFYTALDNYCKAYKCTLPEKDRPKPPAAKV